MNALRILLVSVSLLLVVSVAEAGEETAAKPSSLGEVLARLTIDEPGEAAWGAYLAGRDGHPDAIPSLLELLRHHRTPFTREWNLTHRAALDALILLDARPPEGLLALHAGRFPVQVLVLRARDPEAHLEGLRGAFAGALGREHLGLFGLAVGNLLVGLHDEGFAAKLLERIRLTLEISVYVPGPSFSGRGGVRNLRVGCGDTVVRVPDGFPPFVLYGLAAEGGSGREELARGPRTVWSRRQEVAQNGAIVGSRSHYADPIACALEWVAALLGEPASAVTLETERRLPHEYTTEAAYLAAATKARDALLAAWWDLAGRLSVKERLRRPELLALEPTLTLSVRDRRPSPESPLPDLPPPTRPAFAR